VQRLDTLTLEVFCTDVVLMLWSTLGSAEDPAPDRGRRRGSGHLHTVLPAHEQPSQC
jgi:hypothetical protein